MSINYVISKGGEEGSPKDDLLNTPYLIKRQQAGGGGQKLPILAQRSLWTAPRVLEINHVRHVTIFHVWLSRELSLKVK